MDTITNVPINVQTDKIHKYIRPKFGIHEVPKLQLYLESEKCVYFGFI